MWRVAVVAGVVGLSGAAAEAGICLDEEEFVASVESVEAFAKNPKAKEKLEAFCLRLGVTEEERPALAKRVVKACDTVLKRDPKDQMCIEMAARLHQKELGGVDIYSALSAIPMMPFEWLPFAPLTTAYGPLGDPRGAAHLVEVWKASLAEAEKRRKNKNAMTSWGKWRSDACKGIGDVGGASEKAFVEEQAKAADKPFVRRACKKAAARIDQRLAGAPRAP